MDLYTNTSGVQNAVTFTANTSGLSGTKPHLFGVQRSNGQFDIRIDGASDLSMAMGAGNTYPSPASG